MKQTPWDSSPRVFFSSRPDGVRRKNTFGRPSSTSLFALQGKAHPKWLHETDLVGFVPKDVLKFRLTGASRLGAFQTRLDDPLKLAFGASWFLPKLGVALFLFCPLRNSERCRPIEKLRVLRNCPPQTMLPFQVMRSSVKTPRTF